MDRDEDVRVICRHVCTLRQPLCAYLMWVPVGMYIRDQVHFQRPANSMCSDPFHDSKVQAIELEPPGFNFGVGRRDVRLEAIVCACLSRFDRRTAHDMIMR